MKAAWFGLVAAKHVSYFSCCGTKWLTSITVKRGLIWVKVSGDSVHGCRAPQAEASWQKGCRTKLLSSRALRKEQGNSSKGERGASHRWLSLNYHQPQHTQVHFPSSRWPPSQSNWPLSEGEKKRYVWGTKTESTDLSDYLVQKQFWSSSLENTALNWHAPCRSAVYLKESTENPRNG